MANDRISNLANPAYPDDIVIVDQQSALDYPDNLSDDKHPTPFGYNRMAGVWLPALTGLLETCP